MVARIKSVTFNGIDVREVDVQVQIANGLPSFSIVGLPDKAVSEARERVRAALHAMGMALPPKRITVNLAPADLFKEGSHFDLPIAIALLSAMDILSDPEIENYCALGELSLDGKISPVNGVLPAAVYANQRHMGFVCPAVQGGEAAWAGTEAKKEAGNAEGGEAEGFKIIAPHNLLELINHFKGGQVLPSPAPNSATTPPLYADLADIKGQESAKRATEIAAAGGHNLLFIGPPCAGKSMLAQRLPGLLPPLATDEILESSMIHSLAGTLPEGGLLTHRPYRDPHHSASIPALTGGGMRAKPGEISLAHLGVLFLDELPEFQRGALESLRQPLETGSVTVARANAHVTYPARFQLVAAMNPCRCGYLDDPAQCCTKAPRCARDYQSKISGPIFDRIDLHIDVAPVHPLDLTHSSQSETSENTAARVLEARRIQQDRFSNHKGPRPARPVRTNADADGQLLEDIAHPDAAGLQILGEAVDRLSLSARGYHRVLRVARTLADLEGSDSVKRLHIAEALSFRRSVPGVRN